MVTQRCHIAFSFNAFKPSGYFMDCQGLTFRRFTFYPQRAYLFLHGSQNKQSLVPHTALTDFFFFPREWVYLQGLTSYPALRRYAEHVVQSYTQPHTYTGAFAQHSPVDHRPVCPP